MEDYQMAELRLACLQLANGDIKHARRMSDFVLGRSDAEIDRAAEELAGKVRPRD